MLSINSWLLLAASRVVWNAAAAFRALLIDSTSLGAERVVAAAVTMVVVFVSESFFFDFLAPVKTLLTAVGGLPEITVVVAAVGAIVGCGDILWPALAATGLTLPPVQEAFGSSRLLLFAVTVGATLAGLTVFSSAG